MGILDWLFGRIFGSMSVSGGLTNLEQAAYQARMMQAMSSQEIANQQYQAYLQLWGLRNATPPQPEYKWDGTPWYPLDLTPKPWNGHIWYPL